MTEKPKSSSGQGSDDKFETWIAAIVAGQSTMSQRRLDWAERNGGLDALVARAKASGVHLVELTDDKGQKLLAASMSEFKTLC